MKKLVAFWLAFILILSSVCSVAATDVAKTNASNVIGDADGDGSLAVTDATCIQLFLVGLMNINEQSMQVADVDGDGNVSIMDSTCIQMFLAMLIDKMPAQVETIAPSQIATGSGIKPSADTPTVKPTQKPTEPATEPPTQPADDGTPNEYEMEVLRLVNIEREKVGSPPLEFAYFIYDCAKLRAQECDLFFSHTRPDGSDCFTVFDEFNINRPWRFKGENIAWGHESAEDVMYSDWGWMNSEGHRNNILKPEFKYLAVATHECTEQPGTYVTVQLFWG